MSRPSWRAPLLGVAALQCGLHAINHWVDVNEASSLGMGLFDAISLTVLTAFIVGAVARGERGDHPEGGPPMRVFLAGATGVIGRPLIPQLLEAGHEVTALARTPEKAEALEALGVETALADAFDAEGVREAVAPRAPRS